MMPYNLKFKAGNSWPMLRVIEAAREGDLGLLKIKQEELQELREIIDGCSVTLESGFMSFKQVTVGGLSALMKALSGISDNASDLLGFTNGPRGSAQAKSLRMKVLEVKTRLDLTGTL
jgi:hypothetical protein